MSFRLVPKSVTLNDLERRNGPYFALFHRLRVRCRRKKLLGLAVPRFQNLLLIAYDHINTICAVIWAKQEEAMASTSDYSCLRPCLLMSFL